MQVSLSHDRKEKQCASFALQKKPMNDKTSFYELLCAQLSALLAQETRPITIYANAAALLYHQLPDVSWAGFYLYDPTCDELYLGPFQGKTACMQTLFSWQSADSSVKALYKNWGLPCKGSPQFPESGGMGYMQTSGRTPALPR